MIIFHGSEHIIKRPEYGAGKTYNDYGRGFYCTEYNELAKEWACANNNNGFSNRYEINMDNLSVLNLNDSKYTILNWLAVLTKYRGYWQQKSIAEEAKIYIQEHFMIDVDGYDVIIGNRADDSFFSFVQDFISGTISIGQLEKAMKLGKLGEQVVLKSEKAFNEIIFLDYEEAYAKEYFPKKVERNKKARTEYRKEKQNTSYINDIFILDILRKGMTNDDFL